MKTILNKLKYEVESGGTKCTLELKLELWLFGVSSPHDTNAISTDTNTVGTRYIFQ